MQGIPTTSDRVTWSVAGFATGTALTLLVSRLATGKFSWMRAAMIGTTCGVIGGLSTPGPSTTINLPGNNNGPNNQNGPPESVIPAIPQQQPKARPEIPAAHHLQRLFTVYRKELETSANLDLTNEQVQARFAGRLVRKNLHHSCRDLTRAPAQTEAVLLDLRGRITVSQALQKTDLPIIVVGADVIELTDAQLANPNLYLPEVKELRLAGAPTAETAQAILAMCPALETIDGVELSPDVQALLVQHCPVMQLEARAEQRTIFLSALDLGALRNRPHLDTIVMPDSAWDAVPVTLDLSGLSPQVCEEILLQKPNLRQLTLDTVSTNELRRWHAWGLLNQLQKLDLTKCPNLSTNVFTPLAELPSIAIIDLPNNLARGIWPLPPLNDLILIRELYAKHLAAWGDNPTIRCCPFWASVPNAHGAHLPVTPFGPTEDALALAQERLNAPLALDGDAFLTATPAQQEYTVWQLQATGFDEDRFEELWPIINEKRYNENYPIRALRLSLRLWAEANCPEWVLDHEDVPLRFDPRDPRYCDFQANIEGGEPCYIHKQVVAASGSGWTRDMLGAPGAAQNGNQIQGLSGVSALGFTAMSVASDTIEYRSPIDNPEAYRWAFELAYNPETVANIPPELLDGVVSLALEYQYPRDLIGSLQHEVGSRWLSELPPVTAESAAMTSAADGKRLARQYAGAVDVRPAYQGSLRALANQLLEDDPNFVAQVIIARYPGTATQIGVQAFESYDATILDRITPAAGNALMVAVSSLSEDNSLRIGVFSRQDRYLGT